MRYLVFSGIRFYPEGGANDLAGSFDELEEACQLATSLEETSEHWSQVYDLEEKNFKYKSLQRPWGDDPDED